VIAGERERTSPGLTALFASLSEDGRHSILDLGPAGARPLAVLSRFARQIRFAGLVPRAGGGDAWSVALRTLEPNESLPYDVVLAWDVLDRLDPDQRAAAVARLAEITAPRARLYAVVDGSGAAATQPLTFTLVDVGRVSERASGPPEPAPHPLLPAQVERALGPFEVVRAFMLRTGAREYVAMKRA